MAEGFAGSLPFLTIPPVSRVYELPLSRPSVLSATFSNTCHKIHNSSIKMILQLKRTLMPCSNWRYEF